ncbi:glycoside hydrolase family 2 TIM barrel-domain containing protein [Streptomyces sp. NPDC088729]|uniref:glycoside hydrolase family 2 TIM barrel-domain containing protein n=1 Tax=Streptomyces sp. NPDC088729 TaxID=3365876 RepID=UPI003809A873
MYSPLRRPAAGACAALLALVVGFASPPALAAPAATSTAPAASSAAADTLFSDDFSAGLAEWTRTGSPSGGPAWTARDGSASVDTSAGAAGSYLRPAAALTLPGSYQLTTRVRIETIGSEGTVSLALDMQDADNPVTKDLGFQITGVQPDGRAGVRVGRPLSAPAACSGQSPVTLGDWLDVRVVRAGGVTALHLGGRLTASTASPAAGGTFALGSFRSKVSIGAVDVRALTGTPAGHPATAGGCTWKAPDQDAPGHQVTQGDPAQSLNGSWRFTTTDRGETDKYQDPATSTDSWDTLPVPGNWDTRDRYSTYTGDGWYRRTFTVAHPGGADSRYRLDIGACYWSCKVWVNGALVLSPSLTDRSPEGQDGSDLTWTGSDTHRGGYTPFQLDVTSAIRTSGTNTIAVKANNNKKIGGWWNWGGLSRDVTLTTTEPLSITRQEITATPDLTAGSASVASRVFVHNDGGTDRQVTVRGAITSASTGADVPDGTGLTGTATVPAGRTVPVTLRADLGRDAYSLWQLDDPRLYRLGVSLAAASAPGAVIDGISDTFGIRSVKVSGADMLLNGTKLKAAGANRVSDDPVNGNTEPLAEVRKDLDMMKSAGMNIMRIGHYAQAPGLLDYADRVGMLLIAETPVWGEYSKLQEELPLYKQQMAEMVERDFNHPSIFAWSVANEIQSNTPEGVAYAERMAAFSKNIDPTRLVTMVNFFIDDSTPETKPESDGQYYMDFAAINRYRDSYDDAVENTHRLYPDKPIFVSEFSSDAPAAGKPWDRAAESTDFRTGSDTKVGAFADKDYVFGWSQWTYGDYRSTIADTSSPNKLRGYGVVDAWDRPKASYGAMRSANAPIASLDISAPAEANGTDRATATVVPRGPLATDGPSWTLKGYRLAVRVTDTSGAVVGGSVVDLPRTDPGGGAVKAPVSWKHSASAASVRVSLLSPQGFQEEATTLDLRAPAPSKITATATASGSVRVRFANAVDGLKHTVTATAPDGTVVTAKPGSTAEPFADLTGLANGTAYKITVTAVNGAGGSTPATTTLTPTGTLAAAPNIVKVTPVENGLVLGYTDGESGSRYQVSYTDASGTEKTYTTTARPGTRIEGLAPGATYAVRVRRLKADLTAATAWSEKVEATVPAAGAPPALRVRGTIGGVTSGGVAVDPAPGTVRYEVTVGDGKPFTVPRSGVDLLRIDHLKPGASTPVSVKAVGPHGASPAWSGAITTAAAG